MGQKGQNDSETSERLSRIEQMLARIDERTARYDNAHTDHERRIRSLEDKEARRGGIMATLTTIGSAVGAAIMWLIQHLTQGGGAQ